MKRSIYLGLLALTAVGTFAVDTYIMRVPVEGAVPSDIRYEIKDEVLVRDDYGHTDWTTNDGLTRFMTYFEDWDYQRTGYQTFNGVEKMVSKEIYSDTRPFTVTEEIPFNRADWSIKSFDNCGAWSPSESSVSEGQSFEQSATCDVVLENNYSTQKTVAEAVARDAVGTMAVFEDCEYLKGNDYPRQYWKNGRAWIESRQNSGVVNTYVTWNGLKVFNSGGTQMSQLSDSEFDYQAKRGQLMHSYPLNGHMVYYYPVCRQAK